MPQRWPAARLADADEIARARRRAVLERFACPRASCGKKQERRLQALDAIAWTVARTQERGPTSTMSTRTPARTAIVLQRRPKTGACGARRVRCARLEPLPHVGGQHGLAGWRWRISSSEASRSQSLPKLLVAVHAPLERWPPRPASSRRDDTARGFRSGTRGGPLDREVICHLPEDAPQVPESLAHPDTESPTSAATLRVSGRRGSAGRHRAARSRLPRNNRSSTSRRRSRLPGFLCRRDPFELVVCGRCRMPAPVADAV